MSRSAILSACAATAVALLISAVAQGATCDVEGADALDVAAARDIAQTACGCPSTGPSRPWRRCVRNAIRELRDTGFLSIACERAARRLELRSTCARTDRVVCCRTNGVGETDAVVRAADKCVAPKHGTACTSPFAHVADACVPGGCATEGVCGNSVVEPGEACDPPNGWN